MVKMNFGGMRAAIVEIPPSSNGGARGRSRGMLSARDGRRRGALRRLALARGDARVRGARRVDARVGERLHRRQGGARRDDAARGRGVALRGGRGDPAPLRGPTASRARPPPERRPTRGDARLRRRRLPVALPAGARAHHRDQHGAPRRAESRLHGPPLAARRRARRPTAPRRRRPRPPRRDDRHHARRPGGAHRASRSTRAICSPSSPRPAGRPSTWPRAASSRT